MATQAERLAVVETKVDNIEEKIVDLKADIKDVHDCLDRTRDLLDSKLDDMMAEYKVNRDNFYAHADKLHAVEKSEHAVLAGKIDNLEKQKHKITLYLMLGLAFAAGSGWIGHIDIKKLLAFVSL